MFLWGVFWEVLRKLGCQCNNCIIRVRALFVFQGVESLKFGDPRIA